MCSFLIKERCECITAVGLLCLPVVRFQPLQKYKYLCLSSVVEGLEPHPISSYQPGKMENRCSNLSKCANTHGNILYWFVQF